MSNQGKWKSEKQKSVYVGISINFTWPDFENENLKEGLKFFQKWRCRGFTDIQVPTSLGNGGRSMLPTPHPWQLLDIVFILSHK